MVTNSYRRARRIKRHPRRLLYQRLWSAGTAAERQRIARDLHDTVIQTLYSANLMANSLANLYTQTPEDERSRADELGELIQRALDETRILLMEMRSPLAADGAIGSLLEALASDFTERTRIPVATRLEGGHLFLPKVQITVAQIVREVLNNTAKHARASEVLLTLECERGGGKVLVRDNGNGFDATLSTKGSYGLAIMRERAQSLNASLNIASAPGKGTEVCLMWGSYRKP